jgi:8-oxo-dGTP diphosphatase
VLFFKTNQFSGELASSDEGNVFWIPRKDLETYPLADDFSDMVKIFESDRLSEFYYTKESGQWEYYLK